ncbi:MAG: four helix bundle protein [Acidobacteriia bacterium]|nr:four helix bundle protein [Terriglobia bacterium]
MKGHRDLVAWQQGMEFVIEIYRITRGFPKEELYGLTSQLRRAAVSAPSNLAEGYGRKSRKDFQRFIGMALGSLLEVETQLDIANRLGYVSDEVLSDVFRKSRRVAQLLHGLRAWCEAPVGAAAASI